MNSPALNTFAIAPLEDAEIEALTALAREIWVQHYPGIITVRQIEYMLAQRYSPEALRAQIAYGNAWWDKLVVNGVLGGFASYEAGHEPGAMKLDKLYVHQIFRGKGYGSALIRHVEEASRGRGCNRLYLQVNKFNQLSVAAYQRNGFAIVKMVKVDIGGGFFMDDFVMSKELAGCA